GQDTWFLLGWLAYRDFFRQLWVGRRGWPGLLGLGDNFPCGVLVVVRDQPGHRLFQRQWGGPPLGLKAVRGRALGLALLEEEEVFELAECLPVVIQARLVGPHVLGDVGGPEPEICPGARTVALFDGRVVLDWSAGHGGSGSRGWRLL